MTSNKKYNSATGGDIGSTVGQRMFFGGMIGGTAGMVVAQLFNRGVWMQISFPIIGLISGVVIGKSIK